MTVNNSANKVVAAGNGVQTVFNFSFIAVNASDISVIYTDANGNETTLAPAQYTLTLNAAAPGQIWALGGTVTYPLSGSPIVAGTSLTTVRELSLTQLVSLSNQGNALPSAIEQALDLLEMQLQQVSELFQRAIVAPVVDASAPLPLPPAAQRSNQALLFDASGNPVAGALPASGAISTAMQPVVGAASLAAGRTALGLGTVATEGIGAGLQDDGTGNLRVNTAISAVATNQAIHAANHLNVYAATGALTFTLDRANTLFDGFSFTVYALTAAVTFAPNPADNFFGQSSGTALVIPKGAVATLSTDAASAGTWYAEVTGVSPVINEQRFSASGTYVPSLGLLYAVVECGGGGGGGGGCVGAVGSVVSGGGGGGGARSRIVLSATQIGTSQPVTIGAGGSGGGATGTGGAGGASSLGTLCTAAGGAGGGAGASNTIGSGGQGGNSGTGLLSAGEDGGLGCLANITTVFLPSGKGGDSPFGYGGASAITNGSAGVSGNAGKDYGGGGSGGTENNNAADAGGGPGAPGILIVTEYLAFAA